MRELKFRIWVDDKKYPRYIGPIGIRELSQGGCEIFSGEVAEQFTGLQDKNGVDIYEGDILAVKFNPRYVQRISWDGPPDAIGCVFWDFSGFRLECQGERDERYADFYDFIENFEDAYSFPDMALEHTEVIGNIHQHSELLK